MLLNACFKQSKKKKVENNINILYTLQIFEAICVMACHIYITKCVYVNDYAPFFLLYNFVSVLKGAQLL